MRKLVILIALLFLALPAVAQDKTVSVVSGPSGRSIVSPVVELEAKTAKTASGQSSWLDLEDSSSASFILDAAACTGTTPTLDVKVQYSADKAVLFDASGGAFTQVTTSALQEEKKLKDVLRFVRVSWTIGGSSPSCTFGVKVNIFPKGV